MTIEEIKASMQTFINLLRETAALVPENPEVQVYVDQQRGIVAIGLSLIGCGLQQLSCRGIGDYDNALQHIDNLRVQATELVNTAEMMRVNAITERTRRWIEEAGS